MINKTVRLHGLFQFSQIIKPSHLIGGHDGGVIAYPVAVVEYENGTFAEVRPHRIKGAGQ